MKALVPGVIVLLFGVLVGCGSPEPAASGRTEGSAPAPAASAPGGAHPLAGVDPRDSLLYLALGPHEPTADGVNAGRLVAEYLESGRREALEEAIAIYDRVMPLENYGGEYPALRWFCSWALASEADRDRMARDPDAARFLRYFGRDDFRPLRQYVASKYRLGARQDGEVPRWLDEIVRFNGPGRADWEGTDRILEVLALKPGQVVADIGSGPGFYAFRFSGAVGPEGTVYAVETNRRHLDYIREVLREEGTRNVRAVESGGSDLPIPDQALDVAFMCSVYQTIYHGIRPAEREAFLAGLQRVVKPDGRLVVVDNDPLVDEGPPYRGIAIAPELVIGQLEAFGWRLQARHQFVPQRYVLVFSPPAPR